MKRLQAVLWQDKLRVLVDCKLRRKMNLKSIIEQNINLTKLTMFTEDKRLILFDNVD